jgi:hypothetical protein
MITDVKDFSWGVFGEDDGEIVALFKSQKAADEYVGSDKTKVITEVYFSFDVSTAVSY